MDMRPIGKGEKLYHRVKPVGLMLNVLTHM